MLSDRHRLGPEQLRWTCDPQRLGFETTAQLRPLKTAIGQERAVRALEFGVRIPSEGYNIFILGPAGTGRTSMARGILRHVAAQQPSPSDWCYVYNFENPNEPRALELPPGQGLTFRNDMHTLTEDVQRALAAAFESDDYVQRREEVLREFRQARQAELESFEQEARAANMVVGRGPAGVVVAPAKDGEVMSPQEYSELDARQRQELDATRERLQEKLDDILRRHQRNERAARSLVRRLDRETASFAVSHLFEELRSKYAHAPGVPEYLNAVLADVIENVENLRAREDEEPRLPFPLPMVREESHWDRYRVNVLLAGHPGDGAPVVEEPNPTIDNLTGQIEHRTHMGALVTDHTMIRPGALHRANGGYLLLEAEAVLRRPYAWEALKRALKNRCIRIESLQDQLRFLSTVTLEPQRIPLNVKVVLVGTPYLYYLLHSYDDEFAQLFKVKADFDVTTRRSWPTIRRYARFVATRCRDEGLPPFTAAAVALVVEHALRLAADQTRLSTRFGEVADLVREAAYWATARGSDLVDTEDVEQAISEHVRRSNRLEERLIEMVQREFIMLDLTGEAVGQVNGLSLVPLGDYWFGRPTRVTARTFVGKSGVTQIDREAKLTGRLHDKGVLTLTGFLGDRFARGGALTLSASLTFEQNYELIEGDSASSAELYAILSSLANAPIRQGIAVTGSVNQLGDIQAIGGVNEKIEGFFDTCRAHGLTGDQGVLIPRANVQNLMLKREVVKAVQEGKFHLYAVATVDEGMELLTGLPAGRRRPDGSFPPGTLNRRIADTLQSFAEAYDGRSSDSNNRQPSPDNSSENGDEAAGRQPRASKPRHRQRG